MAFHSDFINTQDLQRLASKQRARLVKKVSIFHAVESQTQMASIASFKRVKINVSGKVFETLDRTLRQKAASIFSTKACDQYYDEQQQAYVFDRNDKAFGAVLTYFQSGLLIKPAGISERLFIHELRFYGLEHEAWDRATVHLPHRPPRVLPTNRFQRLLWEVVEYPDTSRAAKILSIMSTVIILISIIGFCVETLPMFNRRADPNDNLTIVGRQVLFVVEAFCVAWFTIEYVARFIGAPFKIKFLYQPLNIVDIAAILPFYTTLILKNSNTNISSFSVLRILRLVRVFRVFKLSRYSKGLQLFVKTIVASSKELLLLFFFMMIVLVLYSSAVYYVEASDESEQFISIPHTFWLAMVTITTVGYGDMVQQTLGGKIIGSFLAVTGVLVIALPIPVIVNNFTKYYEIIMRPEEQSPMSCADEETASIMELMANEPEHKSNEKLDEKRSSCVVEDRETVI